MTLYDLISQTPSGYNKKLIIDPKTQSQVVFENGFLITLISSNPSSTFFSAFDFFQRVCKRDIYLISDTTRLGTKLSFAVHTFFRTDAELLCRIFDQFTYWDCKANNSESIDETIFD